jgi:hypothetical protein
VPDPRSEALFRRTILVTLIVIGLATIVGAAAALNVDGGTIQAFELEAHVPTLTPQPQVGTKLKAYKTAEGFAEHGERGVKGEVCVENKGEFPTQGLSIDDIVQVKKRGRDHFEDLVGTSLDVSEKPTLAPGESHCYPYQITFESLDGAIYRNVAMITITNYRTCQVPFGIEVKKDLWMTAIMATTVIMTTRMGATRRRQSRR